MFELASLGTFIAFVIGLFLIPGPAVLLTVSRTIQAGRRGGILAGLGIATGDFIHTLFAALGLSAILMHSSLAFNIVKYAGVAYLLYLGIRALLEKTQETKEEQVIETPKESSWRSYWQAIVAEVLNPKTALFFLALLPQFVHPERGASFAQFMVLGLIFVVLSVLYTTTIVLCIRPISVFVKKIAWIDPWKNKIVGIIYFSLGLKVALDSR